MSLAENVQVWFKKNAASLALKIQGYEVKRSNCTVHVFDRNFEVCRVQRKEYVIVNDMPLDDKFSLGAYLFSEDNYPKMERVFKVLRIPVNRPDYFTDSEGNLRIISNVSH
ncbi:MAG: hypothetical protein ABIH63_03605 [archaeon]